MMTKVQLKRLQKLHDYVKSNVKPKDFHMMDFRLYFEDEDLGELSHDYGFGLCSMKDHSCGTVGCLMGHTPFLFRPQLQKAGILKDYDIDWDKAAELLFGLKEDDPQWAYLFDSHWQYDEKSMGTNYYAYDRLSQKDQKKEALKRIRNMIKSGGAITEKMLAEMRARHVSFYIPEDGREHDNQFC